jgi:YihY family inner membrane protein
MSTATRVPQTSTMTTDELSADDAAAVLRRIGRWRLVKDSFARFRYGDGFSSARALGFQFVVAFIPLVIATVGLGGSLRADRAARAVQGTLLRLAPGSSGDAVETSLRQGLKQGATGERVALVVGLATALLALVTAMGQAERGANRIYGVQRDRPTLRKYSRAAVLALAAGVPAMVGFVLLIGGGVAAEVFGQVYGWSSGTVTSAKLLRWPVGIALDLVAITVLFRWAPRRRQPGSTWMAIGAGVALLLWLVFTGLLALYLSTSTSFGQVYGPLTGIIALLLWSQLSAIALLLGVSFAAQLEAARAGVPAPSTPDPEVGQETVTRTYGASGQRAVAR